MIEVKGLDDISFLINCNLIEKVEFIPETKLTLTNGKYYLVKDTKKEILKKIIEYNRKIYRGI